MMRELFLSECRRFATAALIFAVVHAMLLLYAYRSNFFILETYRNMQVLLLVGYVIAGIAFAVAQIGSYRPANRWLWLMHRPLSRLSIFGAIALSAATMTTLAVGVPALLMIAGIDGLTARVVDLRHYAIAPYLVMACSIAWLTGAAIMLNRSRFAFLVVFVPYVLVLNEATACAVLLATAVTVAVLAAFVYVSFKSDRATLSPGKGAMLSAAAPLVLGFYFLLYWGSSATYQIAMTAIGSHPLNQSAPPVGGYIEANRAEPRPLMLAGLATSGDLRAKHWRQQVALTDVGLVYPSITRQAVPQQMSNGGIMQFKNVLKDTSRNIDFVFKHSAMRFKGVDSVTGADRGWAGLGGINSTQRFPHIPLFLEGYIVTPQLSLTYDSASGNFLPRLQLPEGERIVAPTKKIGDRFYQLTNRRLLAYVADAANPNAPYIERFALSFASLVDDEAFINIAPLLDGTLVSATNLTPKRVSDDGVDQVVYFIDNEGRQSIVAQRKLTRDFPLVFEHAAWVTSPLVHSFNSCVRLALELSGGRNYQDYDTIHMPRPPLVWCVALLLMGLSGACALFLRRSIKWALACALLGLPGLATMLVLTSKQEKE
jgi:hypothetical protein